MLNVVEHTENNGVQTVKIQNSRHFNESVLPPRRTSTKTETKTNEVINCGLRKFKCHNFTP